MESSKGILRLSRSELKGFDFDATDCPDLFPPLAALAALCSSPSRIHGVSRLAHKESDRAAAIREEFAVLGIEVELEGNIMKVSPPSRIGGGLFSARGDHRMAMAAGVLALRSSAPITISGAECVAKSYPGFFSDIASLGAVVSVSRD
jgi:3-phosphoshikimate 1-carboxyvinyltransferase